MITRLLSRSPRARVGELNAEAADTRQGLRELITREHLVARQAVRPEPADVASGTGHRDPHLTIPFSKVRITVAATPWRGSSPFSAASQPV